MTAIRQVVAIFCVLVAICNAQQVPGVQDKPIRLEDIERDNLNSQVQKEQSSTPLQPSNYHPAAAAHQQQVAAYQQQQLYLQQLQHQQQQLAQNHAQAHPSAIQGGAAPHLLVPQPLSYNTLPVMIIQQPSLDQLAQYYLMQQQLAALQYQPVTHAVHPALAHSGLVPQVPQVVHILPQQQLPQVQPQPQPQPHPQPQPQPFRSQANSKPFRPSPPLAPAQPRPQSQTLVYTQQHYNPYNTIYQQQQQQKFLSGVKSTPAPSSLKESQGPIQQASQYGSFKSF